MGFIDEIVQLAVRKDSSAASLLRMALVASVRLNATSVKTWIEHELKGYPEDVKVPSYRQVQGIIKVKNPYRGWQDLIGLPDDIRQALSSRRIHEGIAEIEGWLEDERSIIPFTLGSFTEKLMGMMELPMPPALLLSKSKIANITDGVRSEVLAWALELRDNDVHGTAFSFTPQERAVAGNVTTINNNIGSMINSQLHQGDGGSMTIGVHADLAPLVSVLREVKAAAEKLDTPEADELRAEIDTVLAQSGSSKPKRGIIKESLASIRTIVEGAAGNVLASDLPARLTAIAQGLGF